MYPDALSFLEDERDGWRAFEALDELTDDQLSVPLEGAHGWSGRDLMAHVTAPLELCLTVARELAVNESSPTKVQSGMPTGTLGATRSTRRSGSNGWACRWTRSGAASGRCRASCGGT